MTTVTNEQDELYCRQFEYIFGFNQEEDEEDEESEQL